jgi:hypothetical protein
MLRGGVDPGLLDEVRWWRTDDLRYWSLEALAVYVRAAAAATDRPVNLVCRQIAEADGARSPEWSTALEDSANDVFRGVR